jgi:hypothetical protein
MLNYAATISMSGNLNCANITQIDAQFRTRARWVDAPLAALMSAIECF